MPFDGPSPSPTPRLPPNNTAAEAAVLYHANQLDAVAATKPVE